MAGLGIGLPLANGDAAGRQPPQCSRICLVILVGDDDGVAAGEPIAHGLGDDVSVGGCGGAEMDRVNGNVEGGRHADVRKIHRFATSDRSRIGAVRLELCAGVKRHQPIDDRLCGVGPAGIFEKGPALQGRLGKGREVGADRLGSDRKRCRHGQGPVGGTGNVLTGLESPIQPESPNALGRRVPGVSLRCSREGRPLPVRLPRSCA